MVPETQLPRMLMADYGAAWQVLKDKLQIPIDYYALVNYTAFKDTVNAVGGIDVTIQSTTRAGCMTPI